MRRARFALIALLIAAPAAAQNIDVRIDNPALRILQDYTLKSGEATQQVVVIAGDATLDGRVDEDVVVIFGKARLGPTAEIDGSLVVIGGSASVADGARVHGDVVDLGTLDAPGSFSPDGQQVVIGVFGLDHRLRGVVPWLTRGLMLARPIVPGLGWVWIVAGIFFLVNLLFDIVLDAPVRACAGTLRATPVSAFLVGLLVLLLTGPLCVVLAISVIGLAVIPVLLCAIVIAAIIGRVGFARWIGVSVVHETESAGRAEGLRSFVLGSALMCIAYMVPVLGFVVWALAGVFGIGAAAMAFVGAYRREHPKRPKPAPAPKPAATPATVPVAVAVTASPSETVPEPPAASVALPVQPLNEPEAQAAAPVVRGDSMLSFPHASFPERLAAFALDVVLIVILAQVVRFDRLFGEWSPDGNLLLVALVYHIGFWTWKQTTVGGIVCQLRVIRTDGMPLRFAEAFVRGLGGIFSLVFAGVGFLWVLRDPERQAWHDRIAGTFVVNVPRSWPI